MSRRKKTQALNLQDMESRFFEAISLEDEETLLSLLQDDRFRTYINTADKLSLAFVQIVLLNSVKLLQILLQHGADINCTDLMFEENGIMHAARLGHTEMLEYLLREGIDVNHQSNKNGSTAIHVALTNQKHECLGILIRQKGVDLNIQDKKGYSPLLWTARLRDPVSMKMMIEAGCNVESKDFRKGVNALHVLVDNGQAFWKGKTARRERVAECTDLLFTAGLDINKGDVFGNPPVMYALHHNNCSVLIKLIQLNCELDMSAITSPIEYKTMPANRDTPFEGDKALDLLIMAITKYYLRPAKILCEAGVPFHRLARYPETLNFCQERYIDMHEWLQSMVFSPQSLKVCCRNEIRRHIKGDLRRIVEKCELPKSLKHYIQLGDLDKIRWFD